MKSPKKGFEVSVKFTGRTLTTIWLIFFYLFSIWMVIGTLSSYQFQSDIRKEAAKKDGQKSYPVVLIMKLLELEDRVDAIGSKMRKIEEEIFRIRSERDFLKVGYVEVHSRLHTAAAQLIDKLRLAGMNDAAADLSLLTEEMIDSLKESHPVIARSAEVYGSVSNEADAYDRQMNDIDYRLEKAKSYLLEYRNRVDLIDQRIASLTENSDISQERINDLRYMRKVYVYFLALMPSQMLTLFLTLSMGALGSIIYLTRTFIDFEDHKPFSWYIFRTFLGMITAIAVFILVKAGQIIISDNSAAGQAPVDLNPFFISFLAIISGILSEQAYSKIQHSGKAFFRMEEKKKDRWAFGLQKAMTEKNVSAAEIAELTNKSLEGVKNWIQEKQLVPAKDQELIAAYLKSKARCLFSDQPPDK